jgi:hypothetical protein
MKLSLCLAAAFLLSLLAAFSAQALPAPRGPGRPQLPSERTSVEAAATQEAPDLSSYRLLTIRDLGAGDALKKDYQHALTAALSDRLARAVTDARELELEVRRGEPLGRTDELVLSGVLVRAKKGNRAIRYFAGPLARARIVTDLSLSDGASGEILAEGRIKKLWAWPGWAGVTRGLSGLEKGACKEVVDYLRETRPEGSRQELAGLQP